MVNKKWLLSFINAQKAVLAGARVAKQLKAAPQAAVDLVRGSASRQGMKIFGRLASGRLAPGAVRNYDIVDPARSVIARFRVAERVPTSPGYRIKYANYIHAHPAPVAPNFKKYNLTIPKLIGQKNTRRIARQFMEMQHGSAHGIGSIFQRVGKYTVPRAQSGDPLTFPSRKSVIMGKRGISPKGAHKEY